MGEKDETVAKLGIKLHTALIEIRKEVEGIKRAPDLPEIELVFESLKFAIKLNDIEGEKRYGQQLCAKVTKYMLDKL